MLPSIRNVTECVAAQKLSQHLLRLTKACLLFRTYQNHQMPAEQKTQLPLRTQRGARVSKYHQLSKALWLSKWPTGGTRTTTCLVFIGQISQWGKKFKTSACTVQDMQSGLCFGVKAALEKEKFQNCSMEAPDTTISTWQDILSSFYP